MHKYPELHDYEWMEANAHQSAKSIAAELGCAASWALEMKRRFREGEPLDTNNPYPDQRFTCSRGECKHYDWCNVNRQAHLPCEAT